MRHKLLKSLLGKYICTSRRIAYCHIDRVIVIEDNKAIATSIAKTLDGRILHWFLETGWSTDRYGVHNIFYYRILKEDELDGYTSQNQAIQSACEGLYPKARRYDDLQVYRGT